ncbi:MAG: hypothetical protein QOG54_1602 [Actinomycetota bacterium]|nr:hypothetical protein [Actinomycetota bacterium]
MAASDEPEIASLQVDLSALVHPDVGTVGSLARLYLMARRLGCEISFANAHEDLRQLVAWMGLSAALPFGPELPLVLERDPEEREEGFGVEEETDP